ncbi:uncharacterized protein LOC101862552 [Aplysia californica]|uniref:Uncharacterized protein LOC101862552 n=1 Tax=Aplysia californica TaxID=6500 RepID=A0ABM0KAM4_APLCA|nr:uncharacterized protein LOC101862552 [Aplysia californica]
MNKNKKKGTRKKKVKTDGGGEEQPPDGAAASAGGEGGGGGGQNEKPSSAQSGSGKPLSAGKRQKKEKKEEQNLIDLKVQEKVVSMMGVNGERGKVKEKLLVDFFKENTDKWYPDIGVTTFRVPPIHINKGKEEGSSGKKGSGGGGAGGGGFCQHQITDARGDRAHVFLLEVVEYLSHAHLESTPYGPMFIISSYQYDNYLSRLKHKIEAEGEEAIHFPVGSGYDRGEIDIMIVEKRRVIFIQIKSVGDNFDEFASDITKKIGAVSNAVSRAQTQLTRDVKVFQYVLNDVIDQDDFQLVKIVALPNLDSSCVEEGRKLCPVFAELIKKQEEAGILHLYKDSMPSQRRNFQQDFDSCKFKSWWITNVLKTDEATFKKVVESGKLAYNEEEEESALGPSATDMTEEASSTPLTRLEKVKIIAGRYVGIISTVRVCNSNSSSLRMEVRRRGQGVVFTHEKFSEIVLTKEQMEHACMDYRLGYLCGPPGSGKTVVLAQKAKRWITDNLSGAGAADGGYRCVVVVNMYRGDKGRAIGLQLVKSITWAPGEEEQKRLAEHCLQAAIDVDNFKRDKFVRSVKRKWPEDKTNCGANILFLVDETYVKDYWIEVFNSLMEEFPQSSVWCAGLYGSKPEDFTEMKLTKVIRCPPKVQQLLHHIDWDEERKKCYVRDSTAESFITDGPDILTVRHRLHPNSEAILPHNCRHCGQELVYVLRDKLNVKKSDQVQQVEDLQIWTAKTSNILILVNMPKTDYDADEKGFWDTTKEKYVAHMKKIESSPMLAELQAAGYNTRVHTELSCPDLVNKAHNEVINVTWLFTYQGLENMIIVYLPGDPALTPEMATDENFTNPKRNIPCPGLHAKLEREDGRGEFTADGPSAASSGTASDSLMYRSENAPVNVPADASASFSNTSENVVFADLPETNGDHSSPAPPSVEFKMPSNVTYQEKDLERYTRWDKNNLFISASRCTSQLILITR